MPIRRHDVHVCLVSEQATPNFIPVLDTRFRPRKVILVVSPQMRERARWLKEALTRRAATQARARGPVFPAPHGGIRIRAAMDLLGSRAALRRFVSAGCPPRLQDARHPAGH